MEDNKKLLQDTGEDVEEMEQSKEVKKKRVEGKKTKKKEKEVVMEETKRKDIEKIKKRRMNHTRR